MRKKSAVFKKNLSIINRDRKIIGLKELKIRTRKCNKCNAKFQTITQDICCPTCRKVNNQFFNYYGAYGEESE